MESPPRGRSSTASQSSCPGAVPQRTGWRSNARWSSWACAPGHRRATLRRHSLEAPRSTSAGTLGGCRRWKHRRSQSGTSVSRPVATCGRRPARRGGLLALGAALTPKPSPDVGVRSEPCGRRLRLSAKVFAAAVIPVVAIRLFRTGCAAAVRRGGIWFLGAGRRRSSHRSPCSRREDVAYSLCSQASRSLPAETLGGSLLHLAPRQRDGVRGASRCRPSNQAARGAAADVLGVLTTALQVGAVLAVAAVLAGRGPETSERFVVAFTASIVGFVAFAKVLSPQYLVCGRPACPTRSAGRRDHRVGDSRGRSRSDAGRGAGFDGLTVADWAVWTLLARNPLLVALFLLLLRELTGYGDRSARRVG